MERTLNKLYYEPEQSSSYAGARHLLNKVKNKYSKNKVIDWLSEQDAFTMHKMVKKNFPRRTYNVSNIYDCFEVDLADFRSIRTYNDNYTYVLFVIDVLSKFLWVEPLKDKSGDSVAQALREIFNKNQEKLPIMVQADRGAEFKAKVVQNVFKDFNIEFRLIRNPDAKAACVERVIQTIKHRIWRYFTHKNTRRYIDILEPIVQSYNNTVHGTFWYKNGTCKCQFAKCGYSSIQLVKKIHVWKKNQFETQIQSWIASPNQSRSRSFPKRL